jgi:hypothetical protein
MSICFPLSELTARKRMLFLAIFRLGAEYGAADVIEENDVNSVGVAI